MVGSPSSQASNDTFAVTTGARVQIYSVRTRKLVKTIARFHDTAHSAEIRYDGRVLVAGDDTGTIQVFDANSRAILKTWKECKQPVWTTKWSLTDSTSLMSCSDDKTVRLWDLPSDSSVVTFHGHQDYVRTGCFMVGQANGLLASGGYDETVRLWDPRASNAAVMSFKHVASVESVLCMPSGATLLAAADNQIAVLDIIAGRPLHMIRNHQKTVTSLGLTAQGTRLISGGLDGHIKMFETTGWNVVAGLKYPSAVLTAAVLQSAVSREDKHIAVGMSSGMLSIKTRFSGEQKVKEKERASQMEALLAGSIADFDKKAAKKRTRGWETRLRGRDFDGEGADIVVQGEDRRKVKKLKKWEEELRAGRYREALDSAIHGQDKLTILTLLNQFRYRSALRASLEDRDEVTLRPVLHWIFQNISHTAFTRICVEVAMNILDIYSKHLGQSSTLAKQTMKLHVRVRQEVQRAQEAYKTKGMLELLASNDIG